MLLGAKADITAFRRSNFPGESHPSTHTPIVDPALFDAAGKILTTRGQDISKRASNASDYLLTGLIVCAGCGKHYLGTAATGRRYRYRYYTCYSRNRYGTAVCTGVRLPADALEAAVLDSLVATYARKDLIDDAVRAAHAASTAGRDRLAHRGRLRPVGSTPRPPAHRPASPPGSPLRPGLRTLPRVAAAG